MALLNNSAIIKWFLDLLGLSKKSLFNSFVDSELLSNLQSKKSAINNRSSCLSLLNPFLSQGCVDRYFKHSVVVFIYRILTQYVKKVKKSDKALI